MDAITRKAWLLIPFLWFGYLLNHADRQVVPVLFKAIQPEFGFTNQQLGLTHAIFLWVYGLMSPIAGLLGDRFSKRKLAVASVAGWSAITVLSGFSATGTILLACRALLGAAESVFFPAAAAMIGNAHGPATRSKAIALFATSQLFGVAAGGAAAARIGEEFHWRASFWVLGATGVIYAIPMWLFLRTMPAALRPDASAGKPASFADFFSLFRIPSLRLFTGFVAISTFSLFLVYSWFPAFLSDKFQLGLARAGFEASVYPQIGNAFGLLLGGWAADRFYARTKASRFLVASAGLIFGAPAIYFIGAAPTLESTRIAAIVFGFCHGFIASNQVACAYEVVPASLRASTIGILNLVGGVVSGMAPYLGGLSRGTIGIDRLMGFTAVLMMLAAGLIFYILALHLQKDREAAEAAG